MRASEAIVVYADRRLGVLHGEQYWAEALGRPDPGGWSVDFGEQQFWHDNGSVSLQHVVMRSRSKLDEAKESAASTGPYVEVTVVDGVIR